MWNVPEDTENTWVQQEVLVHSHVWTHFRSSAEPWKPIRGQLGSIKIYFKLWVLGPCKSTPCLILMIDHCEVCVEHQGLLFQINYFYFTHVCFSQISISITSCWIPSKRAVWLQSQKQNGSRFIQIGHIVQFCEGRPTCDKVQLGFHFTWKERNGMESFPLWVFLICRSKCPNLRKRNEAVMRSNTVQRVQWTTLIKCTLLIYSVFNSRPTRSKYEPWWKFRLGPFFFSFLEPTCILKDAAGCESKKLLDIMHLDSCAGSTSLWLSGGTGGMQPMLIPVTLDFVFPPRHLQCLHPVKEEMQFHTQAVSSCGCAPCRHRFGNHQLWCRRAKRWLKCNPWWAL